MSETAEFSIPDGAISAEALVAEIRAEVAQLTASGSYADARIARAERTNLVHMKDHEEFLDYYLACIDRSAVVDIRAFDIPDAKGGVVGKGMVKFKKTIWGCLKFYTYRMWSQQNQINGLLVNALGLVRGQNDRKIKALEERIATLEAALQKDAPTSSSDDTP